MHIVVLLGICTLGWLVFPKGFKYMVASWVGVSGSITLWACATGGLLLSKVDLSWTTMGLTFVSAAIAGVVLGCYVASRD